LLINDEQVSTYIVSDLHGCNLAFRRALKKVSLKKRDTLIILGDLIDRGSDSKGVLDTIFLLLENGFNVISLRGNHEQMLIDSFDDISSKINWMKNGGKETLRSFLTSEIEKIPFKYIDFLRETKLFFEIDNYILVHAGINMTSEKPLEDIHSLLWLRDWERVFDANWLGERKIIHGHTPMTESDIKKQFKENRKVLCIDNGSYMKSKDELGSICILNLDNMTLHFEKVIDNDSS